MHQENSSAGHVVPVVHVLPRLNLPQVGRLAQEVAFVVRKGDLIALRGELGAGKTAFARAMIGAMMGNSAEDIPSPTFTLVQNYETKRVPVWHFDLYRLGDESELAELGLDDALLEGVAVVEWPERAGDRIPVDRLELHLMDRGEAGPGNGEDSGTRDVTLAGYGAWGERLERLAAMRDVIRSRSIWSADGCSFQYIQGDASVRRYGRISRATAGPQNIVMDWARQPDGPPIRDGKPYSRIARLAEDVRSYVAIADALRAAGFSTPEIRAHDLERGLLLISDFGDDVFGAVLAGAPGREPMDQKLVAAGLPLCWPSQAELWRAATDILLALRRAPVPESMPLPDGTAYRLPAYDREALGIETELLLDWYWPAVHGTPVPHDVRAGFLAAWRPVFDGLLAVPRGWVLRDFHSPNLMWLGTRKGVVRVGILDFQDAVRGPVAYDLVSLLQDARVDVPEALEAELFEHYAVKATGHEPAFDREAFAFAYAALGTQRNTKILGIFARLASRDGKPQYLAHIPRIWRYVERNLAHPRLADLKSWYDRHLPPEVRAQSLAPKAL